MIADTITPKLALGYPNVRRFLRQGREAGNRHLSVIGIQQTFEF